MKNKNLEERLKSFDSNKLIKWLAWILAAAVTIIVVVFFMYFSNFTGELSNKNDVWGTFGDFIGGTLNPILSFFALIALLLTIILQSRELEATREELNRAATAHEKSEKVMTAQQRTLQIQKFESTFFSLLELHNQSLHKVTSKQQHGKISRASELTDVWVWVFAKEHLSEAKETLEENSTGPVGEYFRVLYQLLKFIATNSPGVDNSSSHLTDRLKHPVTTNEKMYSNMVRAFIPSTALQLLAINCHCQDENDSYWTYKLLIERYQFLEHMPFINGYKGELILKSFIDYYENAFGNSDYIIELRNSA